MKETSPNERELIFDTITAFSLTLRTFGRWFQNPGCVTPGSFPELQQEAAVLQRDLRRLMVRAISTALDELEKKQRNGDLS